MADYMKTIPADYYQYRLSEFTGDYSDVESQYKAVCWEGREAAIA